MTNLTISFTHYDRRSPVAQATAERDGATYDYGTTQTYDVVTAVEWALHQLIRRLDTQDITGEDVVISGVTLNAGTKTYLNDRFTNNREIAKITFE